MHVVVNLCSCGLGRDGAGKFGKGRGVAAAVIATSFHGPSGLVAQCRVTFSRPDRWPTIGNHDVAVLRVLGVLQRQVADDERVFHRHGMRDAVDGAALGNQICP